MNAERIDHWLKVGALPTESVEILIKKWKGKVPAVRQDPAKPRNIVAVNASGRRGPVIKAPEPAPVEAAAEAAPAEAPAEAVAEAAAEAAPAETPAS